MSLRMRKMKRSKMAVSVSSPGTSFDAPNALKSGTFDDVVAARVPPLVEKGEQRVEDGRVRFEDFVEKDDFRVGEHSFGPPLVTPLAKRTDVDRAEDFVRLCESRQQIFEIAGMDQTRERSDEGALRRTRRSDEDGVLPRDRRDEKEPYHFALSEEALLERAPQLGETRRQRVFFGLLGRSDRHQSTGARATSTAGAVPLASPDAAR